MTKNILKRKRFLFIPMSWGRGMGPLMDCLAVADVVRERGHIVGFVCKDKFSEITVKKEYTVFPIITAQSPKKLNPLFYSDFPFFQGLRDEKLVRKILRDEDEAIEKFRPDAIFTWLQYTAYLSARKRKVPIAAVARWTGHPAFTSPLLNNSHFPISLCMPLFNRLLDEYSLPKIKDIWELDFVRSDLKIVPGILELEPGLAGENDLHYVGYLSSGEFENEPLDKKIIQWLTNRPTIYVYLSAKQFLAESYIPVLKEAFEDSEFRVIVAVGLKDICPTMPKDTSNVKFVRLISVNKILRYASVLISTGTRGISWQAALNGVPHLTFAGSDPERDFMASMVEKAGAGIRLADGQFNAKDLLTLTRRVLRADMKQKALQLGKKLRFYGGPQKAGDLLIKLANG